MKEGTSDKRPSWSSHDRAGRIWSVRLVSVNFASTSVDIKKEFALKPQDYTCGSLFYLWKEVSNRLEISLFQINGEYGSYNIIIQNNHQLLVRYAM
jgi:hypothetical protein